MCANPDGVTLPVGGSMPVPTAYFPLTNGSVMSWPVPQYWAYNTSAVRAKQTKFVEDDLFGSVASCNASLGARTFVHFFAPFCTFSHFFRALAGFSLLYMGAQCLELLVRVSG